MIRRLSGTIVARDVLSVVLDVGGIGYLVYVPRLTAGRTIGSQCTLLTHLAVRENALDLYGFEQESDLALFELLITLPKIGPKSALQILTQADSAVLEKAVAEQDAGYLTKMTGLGKKTAEKVVTGLEGKLVVFSTDTEIIGGAASGGTGHLADAIDALVALGYPQSDARRAVQQLPTSITSANEAVREALKTLGS